MDQELDLESPAWKHLLRTLGAQPSRSAEAARERELAVHGYLRATQDLDLAVIVIPQATNLVWTHEVPHRAADRGRRISITLRGFVAGGA